jgi:ABC-type multidrug transport system fused ATPase/permease subunit
MYTVQAVLEVSRTVVAAVTCLYFLGALLKKVEARKRNAAPFIWFLAAILLVSVTEAVVIIVRSDGLPNIQPIAATFLYIIGILLQIDHLWTPTDEEEKLAWHALLGSWFIMAVFELLTITELAVVPGSSPVDLVCGAVAASLRFCLVVVMFIMFAWPDRGGYIRLSDNEATAAVEGGTTTAGSNSGNSKRPIIPALKQSVRDEIRAAGGKWPWVKKFRIFLPWIWPSGMPWMVLNIVVTLLLLQVKTAITLYQPHADSAFVVSVAQAYADRNLIPVWKAQGLLLVISLASNGISIVKDLVWKRFEIHRRTRAQTSIQKHLMNHDAAFHDMTNSSDITAAINMGLSVCQALDFILLEVWPQITTFIGASTALFSLYGPHVAMVQVIVTVIYALIASRSNRMLMPMKDKMWTAQQDTIKHQKNKLRGWRTVALNGQNSREIKAYALRLYALIGQELKSGVISQCFNFSSNLAIDLAEFAAMAVVIQHGFQTGSTIGSVIAFRGYWSLVQSPLMFFMSIPNRLYDYLYTADRLRRVMDVRHCMKYGDEDLHLDEGCIEFHNVTFSYIGAEGSVKPIFNGLDLVIEPGKITAIVGPTGIGKSTLLDLITRLYDPQEGSIKIDGQDIKTLKKGA